MESTQLSWAWIWWSVLVLINIINLTIALVFFRKKVSGPENSSYLKRMKLMGVIFIAVALYRSIFVSSYLEQLAWFDTLANSSLLIRSMALFAELSFAGLFMGAMLKLNDDLRLYRSTEKSFVDTLVSQSPKFLFLCIFIAQFFATTALITKFELLFAIEETLWGMAFISVFPLAIKQLRAVSVSNHSSFGLRLIKPFVWINITWLVGYCSYSVFYHLPIEYWPHVLENLKQGNYQILTGIQAVKNALLVVNETRDLSQWGGVGFVIWHTGYFSICAWIVLLLMNGPRLLPARVKEATSVEIQAA
ncbi:hypothetical protein [Endozoicomonas ascidiicola]|uniref:hypothetical protein n=1 Tax=Endozoicomonas ascidiicola TaxID=1698521 RepID=UPI00082B5BDF|nr:hypothetical protein [Endozoicomonas ascidiicola]